MPTIPSPQPVAPQIELRSVKLLLVDDDPDALGLMAQLLGRAGAQLVTANTVERALALLQSFRPDVIVSDIDMPGCDGYQLMRMVRSRTPQDGGLTPAIAVTGFTRDEDHAKALLSGYQTHLGKPISFAGLVCAVRHLTATVQ